VAPAIDGFTILGIDLAESAENCPTESVDVILTLVQNLPSPKRPFMENVFKKKLDSFCFTVINKHNGSTAWRGQIQT